MAQQRSFLYEPMGNWSPSQNQSYPFGSAFMQQWPIYMSQSLNTLKGLPSPYDRLPTSTGSSGVQQRQVNALQQRSPQPTLQDFIHTPDHYDKQTPIAQYSPPQRSRNRSDVGQENDRPFKCDQCPKSFNRNHDLQRHKRLHLAVKPFHCEHCEKSFSRKDTLKRHVLVKGCGKAKAASIANVDGQTTINKSEVMGNLNEDKE